MNDAAQALRILQGIARRVVPGQTPSRLFQYLDRRIQEDVMLASGAEMYVAQDFVRTRIAVPHARPVEAAEPELHRYDPAENRALDALARLDRACQANGTGAAFGSSRRPVAGSSWISCRPLQKEP